MLQGCVIASSCWQQLKCQPQRITKIMQPLQALFEHTATSMLGPVVTPAVHVGTGTTCTLHAPHVLAQTQHVRKGWTLRPSQMLLLLLLLLLHAFLPSAVKSPHSAAAMHTATIATATLPTIATAAAHYIRLDTTTH